MTTTSDALYAALFARSPQTTRELTRGLARLGHRLLLSSDVERLLAADPRIRKDGGRPVRWRALPIGLAPPLTEPPTPRKAPRTLRARDDEGARELQALEHGLVASRIAPVAAFWGRSLVVAAEQVAREPVSVADVPAVRRAPSPPGSAPRYVGPSLRPWQADALDRWLAHKRRGIVQSVATVGRCGVGVLAAWDGVERGEKVLVLVPSADAQEHWLRTLELQLPGLSLGRSDRSGDGRHTFDDCDVLVSLASSVPDDLLPEGASGLLIADEVHRFGSSALAPALADRFEARLGLSVALEGSDGALLPYFDAVLDGCDLRRGREDSEIARYRVGLVPVELLPDERAEDHELGLRIDRLGAQLVATHGCHPETFLDDVSRLQAAWSQRPDAATAASAYLRAVSARRLVAARSVAKLDALPRLAPTLGRHQHSLVFTQSVDDAEAAATVLQDNRVDAERFPHGGPLDARRATIRDLRRGDLRALTAHRPLSSAADLPPVTTVVLLAGTRTGRELVERADLALRPNRSDAVVTLLVVYARGTVEDPDGGHLADLLDAATEVRPFGIDVDSATIAAWSVGL
ncbi:DEAD/DEAH box helicase [Cellulomonas sp. URHE0023]|uniref:DEAD/DEAH box helicase n=1 Tax=Cellulomonas sp. URHE0023 TaxID=1380354 RepID=UPI000486C0E8|nr:DEAD/DEAH box helicase family protein [Cellulomonas sp. URHE0023]